MSRQFDHGENSADGNSENPMVLSDPTEVPDVQSILKLQQDQNAMLHEQHLAAMEAKKQELRMKDDEVAKLKQEIHADRMEKADLEKKLKEALLRVSGLEACNMADKMRISELESAVKDKDQKLVNEKIQSAFDKIKLKKDMDANGKQQEQEKQVLKEKLEQSALWTVGLESRIERRKLEVSELEKTIEDKDNIVKTQKEVFDEQARRFNSELKKCKDQVMNLTEEIKLLQEEKVAFKMENRVLKDKFMIELKNKDILFALTANTQLSDREKLKKSVSTMERTMENQMKKMMMVESEKDALQRALDLAKSSDKEARDEVEKRREKVVDLMAEIARITGQKKGESSATSAPSPPSLNNSADEAHGGDTLSGRQEDQPVEAKKRKME